MERCGLYLTEHDKYMINKFIKTGVFSSPRASGVTKDLQCHRFDSSTGFQHVEDVDFSEFVSTFLDMPMTDVWNFLKHGQQDTMCPSEDCACRIMEKVLYLDKEKLKRSLIYKSCDHTKLKQIETSVLFRVAKLFFLAIKFNDIVLLKILLARMTPNFQDQNGRTSLHYAVLIKTRSKEIVCLLMIFGADPHKCDRRNVSPLRLAETLGKIDLIKLITKCDELIKEIMKRPRLSPLIFRARKELTQLHENVDIYKIMAFQIEEINKQLNEYTLEVYIDDRFKQIENEILNDF